MNELLRASVPELVARVRSRDVSPVELVDAHIARIASVNSRINAVVADRFEAARDEARAAEARVMAAGPDDVLPPLLGVPCTVKEFFGVAGLPNTAGLVARRGVRATTHATAVSRLVDAGVIVLGVTNVPEGGLWMETYNHIYGQTVNPWNAARTPGGSSGGEAAIISAGGVPFGLGSDVGGSIRIPAAFCGVVGHKPSGRLVPTTGHHPPPGPVGPYLCAGPLARRVADVLPVLRVIAGPDGIDPSTRAMTIGDPADVDLSKLVVHPMDEVGGVWVRPSVKKAIRDAADALAARGARVEPLDKPRITDAFEIWAAMLTEEPGSTYAELLGDGARIPLLRELLRLPFRRSNHTAPALILSAIEGVTRALPGRMGRMADAGRTLQADLEAALGAHGVLLYPPYSRPAPRHRAALATPFDFVCTGLWNVLELPATQVPFGFDDQGMPLGVQVVAPRGQDHRALAVAAVLEEARGGWHLAEP